ncbi:MAG: hypothetical protein QXT13_11920 [Pyrobaculum sp.]
MKKDEVSKTKKKIIYENIGKIYCLTVKWSLRQIANVNLHLVHREHIGDVKNKIQNIEYYMRLLDQRQSSVQVTDDDIIYILEEVGGFAVSPFSWALENVVYVTLRDNELRVEEEKYSTGSIPLFTFVYRDIDPLDTYRRSLEEMFDWIQNAQIPDDVKKYVENVINTMGEMENFDILIAKVTVDIYMGDRLIPLGTSTFYYTEIFAYDLVYDYDNVNEDEKRAKVRRVAEKVRREIPEIGRFVKEDFYTDRSIEFEEVDVYGVIVSFPIMSREFMSALRSILNSQLS